MSLFVIFYPLAIIGLLQMPVTSQTVTESPNSQIQCSGRCEESTEDARTARLEYIKWQILAKLKLDAPPNVTRPHLPQFLMRQLVSDSDSEFAEDIYTSQATSEIYSAEEFYARTQEVVIVPNATCRTTHVEDIRCLQFSLPEYLSRYNVTSADLWVYHEQINNVTAFAIVEYFFAVRTNDIVLELDTKPTFPTAEWLRFDLTNMVRTWIHSGNLLRRVGVISGTGFSRFSINSDDIFLKIEMELLNGVRHSRERKSVITCGPNTTVCCREDFKVSFKELGWDDWILEPKDYNAYYCRGECIDFSTARDFRAHAILLSNTENRKIPTVPLCCHAALMEPLQVLSLDKDGNPTRTLIPNMKAKSCNCA